MTTMPHLPLTLTCLLGLAGSASADWHPVTTELIAREKPGYGKACGVVVDHRNGDVYLDLSDRGIYDSRDQGKTWTRQHKRDLKGRTEWPGCMMFDPSGRSRRFVLALVYGEPVGVSADLGVTWKHMDARSRHVDWCAVDWTDPAMRFVLALRHESGGMLILSHDGGKSFIEVGKGYGPAWIFDARTAVVACARPASGLVRTTDGGRTFKPCGSYTASALPRWYEGKLYWVVAGALLATADNGATWQKVSTLTDGRFGPIFGKDARHLFVLTTAGIIESRNGGSSWSKAILLPRQVAGGGPLTWFEYDPVHDVLYAMRMGSDLFRLQRQNASPR
jgi:hypothetical protein